MKVRTSVFLIVLFVFLDQLSKYIVRSNGGFYICNKGIAFGFELPPIFFWTIWLIIIAITGFRIFKFRILNFDSILNIINSENWKLSHWNLIGNWKLEIGNFALAIILSGALSNIIDRLYFGCVIDFIKLPFWPLFNLADSFIVMGAIIILIKSIKR